MRGALGWLAAIALPGALAAQSPASPAADTVAVTSGLLLIAGCPADDCAGSTYWIVREGDRARVAAQAAAYLVPRSDGFWWLDFVSGTSAWDEAAEHCAPDPDQATDSTGADGESPSFVRAVPAGGGRRGPVYTDTLGGGRLGVHWIGTDWLMVSESETGRDEHITLSLYLTTLPGPQIRAHVGPPGPYGERSPPWSAALEACRRDYPELVSPAGDELEYGWFVRRKPTRWALQAVHVERYGDEIATDGCSMARSLTTFLFGYDRVTVPWSAIKELLPTATTAFQSPAGDLLLVLDGPTLYAFFPRGGAPGPVVARLQVNARPIMAQWAVGAHAARWAREVPALLHEGPPKLP